MNEEQLIQKLKVWTVESEDLRSLVGSRIDHPAPSWDQFEALVRDVEALRFEVARLQQELFRSRVELVGRPRPRASTRIAPYSASDRLARLS